jgi:hypothetical protein
VDEAMKDDERLDLNALLLESSELDAVSVFELSEDEVKELVSGVSAESD